MTKTEFLKLLYENLEGFTEDEKREILYDYKEHFSLGKENGKSEEEIIKELGNPYVIARQYHSNKSTNSNYKSPNKKERPSRKNNTLILVLIIFIGIMASPILLGLLGGLIGLIGGAIGITVGGLGALIGSIFGTASFSFLGISTHAIPMSALIFISIGTIALGFLSLIGICYLVKFIFKSIVKLINWLSDMFHKA